MMYVIASNQKWHDDMSKILCEKTRRKFIQISRKEDLTIGLLGDLHPRYVFFPHWSYIVPAEIHEAFECVMFHMTDLPFGRGGSPLQNLVARGIYDTKISAFRCQAEVDAGPVYMKRPLSLHGTAEEIYLRCAKVIETMIIEIVEKEPTPIDQEGEMVHFERRKPQDGDISGLSDLEKAFDYIRMLDADGYPKAFLETGHFRLEFERPSFKHGKIIADVMITKKKGKNE